MFKKQRKFNQKQENNCTVSSVKADYLSVYLIKRAKKLPRRCHGQAPQAMIMKDKKDSSQKKT